MNCRCETEKKQLETVLSGAWGTIGPEFIKAGEAAAKCAGVAHGLVTFSATAALEAILRAFDIGFGDEVIMPARCEPADAMVCAAVGAVPAFADVDACLALSAETAALKLTEKTRALIADMPAGCPGDLKGLRALCKEKGLHFILNLGDGWGAAFEGIPAAKYADAAFADFAQGRRVDAGLAGAVLTDNKDYFDLFYAYHNCGRPMGVGSTLNFDQIVGGDLRVAEWQACLIPGRLEGVSRLIEQGRALYERIGQLDRALFAPVPQAEGADSAYCGRLMRLTGDRGEAMACLEKLGLCAEAWQPLMAAQPFFAGAEFEKLTGSSLAFSPSDAPRCAAADDIFCIKEAASWHS